MHGSTHNLLIDERVDFPLDDTYRERFRALTGNDPLLVVIGCSGAERRLRDLIDSVLPNRQTQATPTVIWARFAQDPAPVPTFPGDHSGHIRECDFRDAGMLLAHIYFFITSRFPASPLMYPAHATSLYPSASHDKTRSCYLKAHTPIAGQDDSPNTLFLEPSLILDGTQLRVASSHPTQRVSTFPILLTYIGALPPGHRLLYVDLEDHHSLGGIIADILAQLRQSDTSVTPLLLPVGVPSDRAGAAAISITAAVRRILSGLSRQKLALVLDLK